jgi:hypothetical protein
MRFFRIALVFISALFILCGCKADFSIGNAVGLSEKNIEAVSLYLPETESEYPFVYDKSLVSNIIGFFKQLNGKRSVEPFKAQIYATLRLLQKNGEMIYISYCAQGVRIVLPDGEIMNFSECSKNLLDFTRFLNSIGFKLPLETI